MICCGSPRHPPRQELMRHWALPSEFSAQARHVVKQLPRLGTLYVFRRAIRHALFDPRFAAAWAKASKKPWGTAPRPPALLAMVTR